MQLREALRRPLPGLPVQVRMSPAPRPGTERIFDPDLNCRKAAVLVLLYPGDSGLYLVLTRRTDSVQSHQGQISLPGGSLEAGETAVEAALREAFEEIDVDRAAVEVLGQLSRLYVPPSNFCIQPVVGYVGRRPQFHPQPDEVAEVIEVPLDRLLDEATCVEEVWQIRGQTVRVPFYQVGRHKVWGATAMMLCELLSLISAEVAPDRAS